MPEILRYTYTPTCVGPALIVCSNKGLCAVLLGDCEAQLRRDAIARFINCTLEPDETALEPVCEQIRRCIGNPREPWSLALDIRGTEFQCSVWHALLAIPPGVTVSYSTLAATLGKPHACRAVASACAANPVAIVVPCHRVLRHDGTLGGYRWGLQLKQWLLRRENELLRLSGSG